MNLDISPIGEHLVKVALEGRLDTQGVDRVEARFIEAIVPGDKSAVVDLSKVDFVSSMGIRMLVSAARSLKTRNAALALFGASPQVCEVFDAVSLRKMIPICATETEALAAVSTKD